MRYLTPLLVAGLMTPVTGTAQADLGDQLFKLLSGDGAERDHFGETVAISGTTAIVGADDDDDYGADSGSAYLFDTTTGEQIAKLLPNDGESLDHFGRSVAISGDVAVVGCPYDDDLAADCGSVYIFDTITGEQLFKLLAEDGAAGDEFGSSVAISGTIAIVGAEQDDEPGAPNCGSAYLFDTTTGEQILKLLADDGAADDTFGNSVAVHGTTAIVGSRYDDDLGGWSGSAYIFDTTTGEQLFKLLADDGAAEDYFGWTVAIGSTTAIVGAMYDDDNGTDSGAAYLFDTTTGTQIAKLLPDDGQAWDWFGSSVAISGAAAVVGASGDDDLGGYSGSAYLFDVTTGDQLFKLLPDDGAAAEYFGSAVAITATTTIVGAPQAYYSDGPGSAYLFDCSQCPADLDGDGEVAVSDLLTVLGAWGTDAGDVTGDGTTDVADLLAVLAAWGPCAD